ncbi:MAG: HPF/RaiA family ribosome-associated protein [Acidobacteriota bacterium]
MQIAPEITSRDVSLSPAQEELIRQKLDMLERVYPRIVGCRIVVEGPGNRRQTGGPYQVRIDMSVPGSDIVVDRQKAEDVTAAIHGAFQAARRQLKDYARKQKGQVKQPEGPPEGYVIKLMPDEGYGFLAAEDGREIYFHRNSVLEPGFDELEIGTEVRYAEEKGNEGPQASTVKIVGT